MEEGTVGDDRSCDGNENTAAYVSHKIDDPGDLIARFLGKSNISRGSNSDESEGNREHLKNSQPGSKTEGHTEREVGGGVIERTGEADKTERSHISRRKLAGGYSCQGHDYEQNKSSSRECLSGTG